MSGNMTIARIKTIAVAAAAAAGGLFGGAASAQDATLIARHEDWTVYAKSKNGVKVCYAVADAADSNPKNVDHGRVVFMVASWADGAAAELPMFQAGYALKIGAPTRAQVGSSRYKMFTEGADAFIENDADEPRLVQDMKRGATMRVETQSDRGTATAYEFSLKGVTAALRAVDSAC